MGSQLGNRKLNQVQSVQEGLVALVGTFTINGSSNPTTSANTGDLINVAITRAAAGRFTFTLPNPPQTMIVGTGSVSKFTANNEDIYVQVDVSAGSGAVTVHTKTGSSDTDPASTEVVTLIIWCTIVSRTESTT